jgi:hypothetical protein
VQGKRQSIQKLFTVIRKKKRMLPESIADNCDSKSKTVTQQANPILAKVINGI